MNSTSAANDLITGDPKTFIGEFEEMDLSALHDKTFLVAISTGDRNKPKFIPETICGPYTFFEMVEVVANIFIDEMVHAKVVIPSTKFGTRPEVLNECTIDYIEAKFQDILMDGLITGDLEKQFTCKAGFVPHEENK